MGSFLSSKNLQNHQTDIYNFVLIAGEERLKVFADFTVFIFNTVLFFSVTQQSCRERF